MDGESTAAVLVAVNTLGPLDVVVEGRPVTLPPSRRRLLSILMLDPRRSFSTDELIDRMWGEEPPATARTALHVNVSELRRNIPILTTGDGYRIDTDAVEHDGSRLERLVEEAVAARAGGDWPAALRASQRAALLWRGPALPDVRDEPFASGSVARIEELFLTAADVEVDALLAQGRNEAAILRLGELVERHPFNDRLRRHLMLALYRAGRQGDALRAFQAYRHLLGETMGIEPGEDLRDLEERILLHDPDLGIPPPPVSPHNLPDVPTSFVGRDDELRRIAKELDEARIVTIVGGPGFGKTRLATEAARTLLADYPGGVWLARLSGAEDSRTVAATIATAVSTSEGVESLEDLAADLRSRPMLLILDNCEHVVEPVSRFVLALSSAPARCRILVTSRHRLGVHGESPLRLRPLESTIDGSVALLADRIRAVDRGFAVTPGNIDSLLQISTRLEGIPLALELVARWVPNLGLGDVARLLDRVRADTALGTAFEWSAALLPDTDRNTLRSLAVFESAFTLERAAMVCDEAQAELATAGTVSRLVDASLLGSEWSGVSARYRMLQPIREMAWERVDQDQRGTLSAHHAATFVESAEAIRAASVGEGQAAVFATLDFEIADHRKAMAHLRRTRAWGELTTMIEALSRYWYARFLAWEAQEWIADIPSADLAPTDRARLHRAAGFLAWAIHDYDEADRHYAALHALGSDLADRIMAADGLYGRGLVHQKRRFLDGAAMLEEAARIYESIDGCEPQLGECLLFRGLDEAYTGDVATAEKLLGQAIELLERTGHIRQISKARRWLAHCAWRRGDEPEARREARSAADIARSVGDHIALGGALVEQAHVEISWGETGLAGGHLQEALHPIPEHDEIDRAQVLFPVARLAIRMGEPTAARAILAHLDDVYERHGWRPLDEIVGVAELRNATVDTEPTDTSIDDTVSRLLSLAIQPRSGDPVDVGNHSAGDVN